MTGFVAQPDWVSEESLSRLHPKRIEAPAEVRGLLARLSAQRLELRRGTNRRAVAERAIVESVQEDHFVLSLRNFDDSRREQIFLNFALDGVDYFFGCRLIEHSRKLLKLKLPDLIYRSERRDRRRTSGPRVPVSISFSDGAEALGNQTDVSGDGIGVEFEHGAPVAPGMAVKLSFHGDPRGKHPAHAEVRHVSNNLGGGRWKKVGVLLTHGPRASDLVVERFTAIEPSGTVARDGRQNRESRSVTYFGKQGEPIRAILDIAGDPASGVFVVIPPAWGRTKESTLALSETIQATFEAAGQAVVVIRFDGIRKRGESFNEPDCMPPVGENRRYTFSQGVRDIETTTDFLEREFASARGSIYLITFSIASVEGRHAIATGSRGRIAGWISIVGAADPQSMIRVVSGGVDYFAGAADGLRFGHQYIQGLVLDVDAATRDAITGGLAFLDDARRDMSQITIPVTWICGTDDAWTSIGRVRDIMSVGEVANRRLIEVPTGHQLRTSREALATFEIVAVELGRIALGCTLRPVQPSRGLLREKRLAERERLRQTGIDIRAFWRSYLVGREHKLGIELVSSTSAFASLMEAQIRGLALSSGATVADLGSGAGSFPVQLGAQQNLERLHVVEIDLVNEGLRRARRRARQGYCGTHRFSYVAANLDEGAGGAALPLSTSSVEGVLASLLVNYIRQPVPLLCEVARVLRPGGRFVVSGMKPDADVSKICVAGVAELRSGEAGHVWERDGLKGIDGPLQEFISRGAQLLDLEEAGAFQFWDVDELRALVESRFFRVLSIEPEYGKPPQALLVVAQRTMEPFD